MVKVLFRRPCHVPPCLINGEGGSNTHWYIYLQSLNSNEIHQKIHIQKASENLFWPKTLAARPLPAPRPQPGPGPGIWPPAGSLLGRLWPAWPATAPWPADRIRRLGAALGGAKTRSRPAIQETLAIISPPPSFSPQLTAAPPVVAGAGERLRRHGLTPPSRPSFFSSHVLPLFPDLGQRLSERR